MVIIYFEDLWHLRIGRLNIIKMRILLNLLIECNPHKYLKSIFCRGKKLLKFIWNRTILKKTLTS